MAIAKFQRAVENQEIKILIQKNIKKYGQLPMAI